MSQTVVIPTGWQLVPYRLTQHMADAAKTIDARLSVWKYDDAYKAMLANAPACTGVMNNDEAAQEIERLRSILASYVSKHGEIT